MPSNHPQIPKLAIWRIYFLFAILQGGLALVVLLWVQPESETGLFLGLSPTRLVMGLALLLFAGLLGVLLLASWRKPAWAEERVTDLQSQLARPGIWGSAVLLCSLAFLGGAYLASLTPDISEPFTRAYFERLLPILLLCAGLGGQTLLALPVLKYGPPKRWWKLKNRAFYITLAYFGLVFIGWSWVAQHTLAQESLVTGWNTMGIPILETQVFLAWLASLAMLLVIYLKANPGTNKGIWPGLTPGRIDLGIAILLWLGTIILWNSIPITPNWFVATPRPPNNEFYPNSDALSYDLTAQQLLVGEGLQFGGTPFVRRPMHTLFLTALHLLGGQNYTRVVFWQIVFLAFIPVLIYFLARHLHNRIAGVSAATLISLREANSIAIAGNITASHAKLLMADLPATLGMLLFIYAAILWLEQTSTNQKYALIAGGALGITLLIRPELGLAGVVIAGIAWLILRLRLWPWVKALLPFLLGTFLVVAPWIWRNWTLTGLIFLDSPSFRVELLSNRYISAQVTPTPQVEENNPPVTPAAPLAQTTAEPVFTPQAQTTPLATTPTPAQPAQAPIPYLGYVLQTAGRLTTFIRQNSGEVAGFILSHDLNSQTQTLLTLPTVLRLPDSLITFLGNKDPENLWYQCCSLENYVRRLPYWHKWDGIFTSQTILPLLLNLLVIALGVSQAWQKHHLTGLTPLLVFQFHLLVNAVFRNSGGRYILPVDWVGVLYFSIGLATITTWFFTAFTGRRLNWDLTPEPSQASPFPAARAQNVFRTPGFYLLAAGFLLLGSLPPAAERLISPLYTQPVKAQHLAVIDQSNLLPESLKRDFGGKVLFGRGLFPRYYPADQGEPGTKNPLGPQPFSRLGFYILGPQSGPIVIPYNQQPSYFPNNSDVLVYQCKDGDVLATAIFNQTGDLQAVYLRNPFPPDSPCPLPDSNLNGDQ